MLPSSPQIIHRLHHVRPFSNLVELLSNVASSARLNATSRYFLFLPQLLTGRDVDLVFFVWFVLDLLHPYELDI